MAFKNVHGRKNVLANSSQGIIVVTESIMKSKNIKCFHGMFDADSIIFNTKKETFQ